MEKNEGKIDMDALDAITDRVLSYRPPKSKARRPAWDGDPSPSNRGAKSRRKKNRSKEEKQEQDNESS